MAAANTAGSNDDGNGWQWWVFYNSVSCYEASIY